MSQIISKTPSKTISKAVSKTISKPRVPDTDASATGSGPSRLFRLSAPAFAGVAAAGAVALGLALYLRYRVIQNTEFGLACDAGLYAGLGTWLCLTRTAAMALLENGVFGAVSLAAAVVALIRPGAALVAIAVAASAFGVVLHNDGLSGFAAALLMLCFARPVPGSAGRA